MLGPLEQESSVAAAVVFFGLESQCYLIPMTLREFRNRCNVLRNSSH